MYIYFYFLTIIIEKRLHINQSFFFKAPRCPRHHPWNQKHPHRKQPHEGSIWSVLLFFYICSLFPCSIPLLTFTILTTLERNYSQTNRWRVKKVPFVKAMKLQARQTHKSFNRWWLSTFYTHMYGNSMSNIQHFQIGKVSY